MRVNIIRPKYLTDQHLLAEYNELNMVAQSFSRSLLFKNGKDETIPKEFTLNSGHVKFFYNKGKYLYRRFYDIKSELRNRGINARLDFKNYWLYRPELFNDWRPKKKDYDIIFERIKYKIGLKPEWYKYYRKRINENFLEELKHKLDGENERCGISCFS